MTTLVLPEANALSLPIMKVVLTQNASSHLCTPFQNLDVVFDPLHFLVCDMGDTFPTKN